MKTKVKRLWEVDALRGVAIIMMVFYHSVLGTHYAGLINYPQINTGFWRMFAITTATIFIFLVGVSLTFSYSRIKNTKMNYRIKYIKRGIKIIFYGLIITAASFMVFRERFVYFGVLHFIGTGIILAIPFLGLTDTNFLFGSFFVLLGALLSKVIINSPSLAIFGIKFWGMNTVDYFPIFPWLGVVLFGIFVGNKFYPNGERRFNVPEKVPFKNVLSFLGRHSLIIYFLHALAILCILFVIKQI